MCVYDVDGKRYFDFLAGYSALNQVSDGEVYCFQLRLKMLVLCRATAILDLYV